MKPDHAFSDARPLASHCPALLRESAGPADLLPALDRAGERLARALRPRLAPLLGGKAPQARHTSPVETTFAEFAESVAPLAGNSLMQAGPMGETLLISVEAAALLRIVDRAFGGPGEAPDPLPGEFPVSAELMIGQLEGVIAAALVDAAGEGASALRSIQRDGNLAQLAAFPATTRLVRLDLIIEEPGRVAWTIALAIPHPALAVLMGSKAPDAAGPESDSAPTDPAQAPFSDLPLPVRAVMAELDLSVSAVSTLRLGQILPVPMARIVPLKVGFQTIAHGTVGAVDDRVAIQITRLS